MRSQRNRTGADIRDQSSSSKELRVWPRERELERRRAWYEQRFLPTLEALTRLDVERVLVTHGEPVLRNGARELVASLARPPWRRSSLY